jgi:hypothetical protein
MKQGPEDDSPQDMRWDEKDPVWRLLGRAPLPEPDGWFAARTVARCRNEKLALESAGMVSLASVWRWVLGGGAAICMALALAVTQQVQNQAPKADDQKGVQEAFQIIASIDNTDSESSSSSTTWQDSSL